MAYKEIGFTEAEVSMAEALILNGYTEEQISEVFGVSKKSWENNLRYNPEVKKRLRTAVDKVLGDTVSNLKKLSDGFVITEKEFVAKFDLDYKKLELHKERLIRLLEMGDWKSFLNVLLVFIVPGEVDGATVKVRQKEMPPDLRANTLILQAHKGETWDVEAKKKRIPQTKIIVSLNGNKAKEIKTPQVKADYTIEG